MAKKVLLVTGMSAKGVSNQAIIDTLGEHGIEISTTPVIFDIVESPKNPDWTSLFLMAEVKLKSNSNSLTKAQLRIKGWGESTVILRSIEAVPTEVAEDYKIGDELEGLAFQIQDSIEPFWDNQSPRITKDDELLVDTKGNEVFRQAVIIDEDELEKVGHSIIAVKPVVAPTPAPTPARTNKRKLVS